MTTFRCAGRLAAGRAVRTGRHRLRRNGNHHRHRSGRRGPRPTTSLPGVVFPGFADAHSHVFHRALRGRTHGSADRGGTFWTWREAMYRLADRLTPETFGALAEATYAELVCAGVTAVGEFHYLHHDRQGRRYAEPNLIGLAAVDAGAQAGLAVTLLDIAYLAGGFGDPGGRCASPVQRRGRRRLGGQGERAAAGTCGTAWPSIRSAPCRRRLCRRSPRSPWPPRPGCCTCTCPSSRPRTRPAWLRPAARRPRCWPTPVRSARIPRRYTPPT